MSSLRQPESSCQLFEVSPLIWKGRGKSLMLRLKRMSAATSAGAVSESVPLSSTCQLATAPTAFSAVAVGERVVGEFVVDGLCRANQLAEPPAIGSQSGRLQAVAELEIKRHALFEGYLKLAGQLGLEAAVYRQAAVCGERGAGTGNVDAFRPRACGCKSQQAAGEQAKQFFG